ncbi:MAG: hypothetical protein Q4F50_12010 [Bacteroides sp.]|nr:hypothetical protein [Bacteroides sp.]MDO5420773.1 hypothetical protein [Bacteroides sp.]
MEKENVAGCAVNCAPSLQAADFAELLDGEEDRKGMLNLTFVLIIF